MSYPFSSKCVAKECRKVWQVARLRMPNEGLASWRENTGGSRHLPKAQRRQAGTARAVRVEGNPLASRKAVNSGNLVSLIPKPPRTSDPFSSEIATSLDPALIMPKFGAISSNLIPLCVLSGLARKTGGGKALAKAQGTLRKKRQDHLLLCPLRDVAIALSRPLPSAPAPPLLAAQ